MSEYITMRDCLKLDLKDAIAERDSLQDQRDFCMGEIKRLREDYLLELQEALRATRERDEAREALRSVMDWNPKPEYWERPDVVARFEADMARARKILEETE